MNKIFLAILRTRMAKLHRLRRSNEFLISNIYGQYKLLSMISNIEAFSCFTEIVEAQPKYNNQLEHEDDRL